MCQTVTVDLKEYLRMIDRLDWLDCLEAAGVDNWEGVSCAREMYEEQSDEDN